MARGVALSIDLRKSIITSSDRGESAYKIATAMNLSRSTVRDIISKYKKTNKIERKKIPGRPSKITPQDLRSLKKIIKEDRRCTTGEIVSCWNVAMGKSVSSTTCRRYIKKIGYSFYKVRTRNNKITLIMCTFNDQFLFLYRLRRSPYFPLCKRRNV